MGYRSELHRRLHSRQIQARCITRARGNLDRNADADAKSMLMRAVDKRINVLAVAPTRRPARPLGDWHRKIFSAFI